VSGIGRWSKKEIGSGAISSTTTSIATVRFGGTATLPTYAGTQTVKTAFSDGVVRGGGTIRTLPFKSGLRITRAGHCRVTGSRTTDGVSCKWTALLKGSGTCKPEQDGRDERAGRALAAQLAPVGAHLLDEAVQL
jgi:hypothetical protein